MHHIPAPLKGVLCAYCLLDPDCVCMTAAAPVCAAHCGPGYESCPCTSEVLLCILIGLVAWLCMELSWVQKWGYHLSSLTV